MTVLAPECTRQTAFSCRGAVAFMHLLSLFRTGARQGTRQGTRQGARQGVHEGLASQPPSTWPGPVEAGKEKSSASLVELHFAFLFFYLAVTAPVLCFLP